jgi:hypothetical protein
VDVVLDGVRVQQSPWHACGVCKMDARCTSHTICQQ